MMWLAKIPALFAGNGLIIALMAAGGVMLATWRHDIKESGRQEVRVEIKRETDAAISRGAAAANKSVRVQPSRGTPLTYRD